MGWQHGKTANHSNAKVAQRQSGAWYSHLHVSRVRPPPLVLPPTSGGTTQQQTTIMDNEHNNVTAGAEEVPVKKYKFKLSEIIRAMRRDEVELDCKALLAYCDADAAECQMNIDLIDFQKGAEYRLGQVHLGLSKLMQRAMCSDPEAAAIFTKYHCIELMDKKRKRFFEGLNGVLADEDGKEGEDHE